MFGGHLVISEGNDPPTLTAQQSPSHRTKQLASYLYANNNNNNITTDSCMTINGSSVSHSPSPTVKVHKKGQASYSNMGFLDRMAKQQSAAVAHKSDLLLAAVNCPKPHDDPMSHTFSSLSPKQVSAQAESKNILQAFSHNGVVAAQSKRKNDEMAFINPFSIAARKESDQNSEGEVTAEGFYKAPDAMDPEPLQSSPTNQRKLMGSATGVNGNKPIITGQQQLSPFDVVLQEQQKQQITRKIKPNIPIEKSKKSVLAVDANPMGRASNPLQQISKLQIVALNQNQASTSAQISGRNPVAGQAVFKIKRSQIIPSVSKIHSVPAATPNDSLIEVAKQANCSDGPNLDENQSLALRRQASRQSDGNAVQFKKQFSRVSTGAANLSSRPVVIQCDTKSIPFQQTPQQQNVIDRLKSIEKINEERIQLVGLKNQTVAQRKNEVVYTDAFDVDLQVSSDYGGLHDLEQVDQLRSINSVSLNQGVVATGINNTPLLPSNGQNTYLNQQQTAREASRNAVGAVDHHLGRKNLTQSRGNPFQPASPATSDSLKLQLQEQAAFDRNQQFLSQVKITTSQSQDRRSMRQNMINQKNLHQEMFSPSLHAQKAAQIRLNSESRRVTASTNQPFSSLFSQKEFGGVGEQFASPRSNQLAIPNLGLGLIQSNVGTPYEKQNNQFGLFLGENDPLSELHSPSLQSRQNGIIGIGPPNSGVKGQGFFHDLHVLNHSATQDINGIKDFSSDYFDASGQNQQTPQIQQPPYANGASTTAGAVKLGLNKRVSVHQLMQNNQQQQQQQQLLRSQIQTREDNNFRKINSQGLMQPTYNCLEPYSTIEGNISVDHFPGPPVNHNHGTKQSQDNSIMTSHRLKRGESLPIGYPKQGPLITGAVASSTGQQLTQRQQIGRFYDNYLAPHSQQSQQTQNQNQSASMPQKGCSIRPVASKHIPQVFRQNHHRTRRHGSDQRLAIGSRDSGIPPSQQASQKTTNAPHHIRQGSNQKQRSFSNDARIMLHESKKLEQRFQQNQQAINNAAAVALENNSSLILNMQQNKQKSVAEPILMRALRF